MSYIDDINIFNDPIISKKRKGDYSDPYRKITESLTVGNDGKVLLTEIPNKKERVQVNDGASSLAECDYGTELTSSLYYVDYPNGIVSFHSSLINQSLTFTYLGEGVSFSPASRIWVENDNVVLNAKDKFVNIDNEIAEQKARVDQQIQSVPQPSEVLDMRVDKNGNTFSIAKDRIDAEQAKIEEAYVDVNNKIFPSLKDRIDAEQMKIENALYSTTMGSFSTLSERLAAIDNNLDSFNHNISSLQDSLLLKVDSSDFNGTNIISKIELTPDSIKISANKINLDGAIGINALDSTILNTINNVISKSNINLTDSLPTALQLDTNGITAYTSDITKYARLNQNGLYIKNGALTIERSDGYKVIDNGILQNDFNISPAYPPFTAPNVDIWGYFWRTQSTNLTDCQFYSFKHDCRYLKVLVNQFTSNPASGSVISLVRMDGVVLATRNVYTTDQTEPGQTLVVDLGVPDGAIIGFYVRLRTEISGNYAYGRVIRTWKEQ